MAVSTYGDIGWRVGIYAVSQMLKHAEPIIVLGKLGMTTPVPKNKGQVVKFRRPIPWGDTIVGGPANSATGSIGNWTSPLLTEGVPPASIAIAYNDVQCTISQYGRWKGITDVIADLAEDPVLNDQMVLAGEDAAEVMELLTYNLVRSGTNVNYVGGASRATVAGKLTLNAQRAAIRALKANRGKPVSKILGPSTNISTQPIEAAYIGIGHTDLDADIRNLPGFVPTAEYGNRQPICNEELGACENVRYLTSPLFAPLINAGAAVGATGCKSTGGANIDVYPLVILGQDSFGITPLKGVNAAEPKVLNPNVPRGGDPLGQQGSVGWKGYWAGVRAYEMWMQRLEVGVSNLA